jgi:hypothetical protein
MQVYSFIATSDFSEGAGFVEIESTKPILPVSVNVKVKLSLCLTKHHTKKTYRGNGGITPCILPRH